VSSGAAKWPAPPRSKLGGIDDELPDFSTMGKSFLWMAAAVVGAFFLDKILP